MSDAIPKILIVEDDVDLQNVYSMILKSQGYRVETANDGMEGLSRLNSFEPDLVLLDYLMPRMDGKAFLQNYDDSQHKRTRIVVASNVSDQAVLNELVSLGAYKTVLKANLSPSELLALVDEMILLKN